MGHANQAPTDILKELCLIGDILGFVQLGTQLLTSPKELYGGKGFRRNERKDTITSPVGEEQKLACKAISQCRSYESRFCEGSLPLDLHAHTRECCYNSARRLRRYLERVRGRGGKSSKRGGTGGLRAALVKVWSKKEMKEQVQHLRQIRDLIEEDTFDSLIARITPSALEACPEFPWLKARHRELIIALSAGCSAPNPDDAKMTSTQVRTLCLSLSRSEANNALPQTLDRRPSVFSVTAPSSMSSRTAISTSTYLSASSYHNSTSSSSCSSLYSPPFESNITYKEARVWNQISEQLLSDLSAAVVPSATDKRPNVESDGAASYHDTYIEILQEESMSGLRSWLEERRDGHVYWVSGPRGSGKSTLMGSIAAYMCTRGLTIANEDELNLIVVKLTYSSRTDRRQEKDSWTAALYRSILEWSEAYCRSLGHVSPVASSVTATMMNWSFDRVKAVVDWLFTQEFIPFRACLLVDGLDEFSGITTDRSGTEDVDGLVRQIIAGKWSNAKCCISTQPSGALSAAFENRPSLQMAELTRPAMRKFAMDQLSSHAAVRAMRRCPDSKILLHQCAQEIADLADGVFLWTELAISTAMHELGGRAAGNRMHELRGRMRSLPRRLDGLYAYIIHTKQAVKGQDGVHSSRLFRLVAAASTPQEDDWTKPSPLSLLVLFFALEDDVAQRAIAAKTGFLEQHEVERCREAMALRLPRLSGGLIKVQGSGGDPARLMVTFINDAVAALAARSNKNTPSLRPPEPTDAATTDESPNLALLSAIVLSMKTKGVDITKSRGLRADVDAGILYARRAEAELGFDPILNRVTDELVEGAMATHPCWFQLNDTLSYAARCANPEEATAAAETPSPAVIVLVANHIAEAAFFLLLLSVASTPSARARQDRLYPAAIPNPPTPAWSGSGAFRQSGGGPDPARVRCRRVRSREAAGRVLDDPRQRQSPPATGMEKTAHAGPSDAEPYPPARHAGLGGGIRPTATLGDLVRDSWGCSLSGCQHPKWQGPKTGSCGPEKKGLVDIPLS
ncbi:hypothetical protein PG997_001952 [Apiospora hydei]|uniref:Nephrocystin 3-like N-terminal domain-containing protein n=1 Tax=Apiospora hydei TaxID=1337664 RepID=A0ABR1X7Y6_9PEZI